MFKQNLQSRDFIIDNIKGFGMILVVLGHMPIGEGVHLWIYSFHMPLFAFVSAIFLRKYYKGELMKKVNRLIIPFFIFSLISWFCYTILTFVFYPEYLTVQLKKIVYIVAGSGQNACAVWGNGNVTLWFLPFLFLSILVFWLSEIFRLKFWDVGCSMLLAYLCAFYDIKLPANLDTVFLLYPFIRFGSYYKILSNKISSLRVKIPLYIQIILLMFLILVHYMLCQLNGAVDTASNVFGNNIILFYLTALLGVMIIVLFFNIYNKHNQFLEYIGRNSMVYLIFNIPLIQLFGYICGDGIECVFGEFIFVLLITIPICYFLTNYFPFLLGVKKSKINNSL